MHSASGGFALDSTPDRGLRHWTGPGWSWSWSWRPHTPPLQAQCNGSRFRTRHVTPTEVLNRGSATRSWRYGDCLRLYCKYVFRIY